MLPVHEGVDPGEVVLGLRDGDRLAVQGPGDGGWRVASSYTLQRQEWA